MSSTTVSFIVLACVFGGALRGILLHAVLPQHHLRKRNQRYRETGAIFLILETYTPYSGVIAVSSAPPN